MKLKTFLVVTLLLALTSILVAQNGAPATFKLNAEASKAFAQLNQRQAELRREYEQLEVNKLALRIGAGVPADFVCESQPDAIVVCSKPKPPASPNPTPK